MRLGSPKIFRRAKNISATSERGRYGWQLENPVAFETPILYRGLQSLGTPPAEVCTQIFDALRTTVEQQEALNNNKNNK